MTRDEQAWCQFAAAVLPYFCERMEQPGNRECLADKGYDDDTGAAALAAAMSDLMLAEYKRRWPGENQKDPRTKPVNPITMPRTEYE